MSRDQNDNQILVIVNFFVNSPVHESKKKRAHQNVKKRKNETRKGIS